MSEEVKMSEEEIILVKKQLDNHRILQGGKSIYNKRNKEALKDMFKRDKSITHIWIDEASELID